MSTQTVGTAIRSGESRQISELMVEATNSVVATLTSLVDSEVNADDTEVLAVNPLPLHDSLSTERTVATANFSDALPGNRLYLVLESTGAAAIAAEQTDKNESDLATTILAGLDKVLSDKVGESVTVQFEQHSTLTADDKTNALGEGPLVVSRTTIHIGEDSTTEVLLCIDAQTAATWNGQPIAEIDGLEDNFAAVPTRGTIACYLADGEPYDLVRRACRRVGLDIDHRPASEVPNPAAYRGRLVLVDIPIRGERRFEWCKRLKAYDESCRVVVMLRQPSRQRVVEGFLAKPDVLIGWPIAEAELATKLDEAFAKLDQVEQPESD